MSKERQSKKTKIIVGALVVGAVGICTAFMLYNTKFAPTQAEQEMEIQEESNVVIDETLEQEVENATGMEIVEETVEVELTEDEVAEEVSTEPDGVSESIVEVEEEVADAETTEGEVAQENTEATEGEAATEGEVAQTEQEVAQNEERVKPQESSEPQDMYPAGSTRENPEVSYSTEGSVENMLNLFEQDGSKGSLDDGHNGVTHEGLNWQ